MTLSTFEISWEKVNFYPPTGGSYCLQIACMNRYGMTAPHSEGSFALLYHQNKKPAPPTHKGRMGNEVDLEVP